MVETDDEELRLRFEVTQLQYKMNTRRDSARSIEGLPFFGAQIKMNLAFTFGKVRQAKEAFNFFGGQNGKALRDLSFGAWQG